MTEPKKIHEVQPTHAATSKPTKPGGSGGAGADGLVAAMVSRATTTPDYTIEKTEIRAMTESLYLERLGPIQDHARSIQEKGGGLFALCNAERQETSSDD